MKKEDTEMMLRIFETERAGYAYLYPSDGGERKEDYISTTAENIANYIGSHMFEAEKIVITDMCDRLILDTCGYFINSCPNQEFCKEIHPFLIPIQMGEKDAGEVLSVSRDVAEQYFREEDEAATMAVNRGRMGKNPGFECQDFLTGISKSISVITLDISRTMW